ncbi:MAG: hypothetical protein IKS21_03090 [Oscillospiraceae bacterium]|nr:hypothetical protein [Oscillospiraceae bacterium]
MKVERDKRPVATADHSGLSSSAYETERRDEHYSSGIRNECNLPQANPTSRTAATQHSGAHCAPRDRPAGRSQSDNDLLAHVVLRLRRSGRLVPLRGHEPSLRISSNPG